MKRSRFLKRSPWNVSGASRKFILFGSSDFCLASSKVLLLASSNFVPNFSSRNIFPFASGNFFPFASWTSLSFASWNSYSESRNFFPIASWTSFSFKSWNSFSLLCPKLLPHCILNFLLFRVPKHLVLGVLQIHIYRRKPRLEGARRRSTFLTSLYIFNSQTVDSSWRYDKTSCVIDSTIHLLRLISVPVQTSQSPDWPGDSMIGEWLLWLLFSIIASIDLCMAIKIHPAVAFFVSSDGDEYENRRVRGAEGEREAYQWRKYYSS